MFAQCHLLEYLPKNWEPPLRCRCPSGPSGPSGPSPATAVTAVESLPEKQLFAGGRPLDLVNFQQKSADKWLWINTYTYHF